MSSASKLERFYWVHYFVLILRPGSKSVCIPWPAGCRSLKLNQCCGSASRWFGSGYCFSLWCGSRYFLLMRYGSESDSCVSTKCGSGSRSYHSPFPRFVRSNTPKWPSKASTFSLWCGSGSCFPLWCGSGSSFPLWSGSGSSFPLLWDPDADADPASENDAEPCGFGIFYNHVNLYAPWSCHSCGNNPGQNGNRCIWTHDV